MALAERFGLLAIVYSSLRKIVAALAAVFFPRASALPIPSVTNYNRLQGATTCRRRRSLAFMISFMSAAGRISKTLPYFRAGCCVMSCTA